MSARATAYTDRSGTIATGATSQVVAAANSARRYMRISNPSTATESLWVNDKGGAASSSDGKSFEIEPGVKFTWEGDPPATAIAVTADTAGHAFEAAEG